MRESDLYLQFLPLILHFILIVIDMDGKYFVVHPQKIFGHLSKLSNLPLKKLPPSLYDFPFIEKNDITSISSDPKFIDLLVDLELVGLNSVHSSSALFFVPSRCESSSVLNSEAVQKFWSQNREETAEVCFGCVCAYILTGHRFHVYISLHLLIIQFFGKF